MNRDEPSPAVPECGCEVCRKFREVEYPSMRDKEAARRKFKEVGIHEAINRLLRLTIADERTRRQVVGVLSLLRLTTEDEASVRITASITGLDPRTIRRGRDELTKDFEPTVFARLYGRIRKAGGGRKKGSRSKKSKTDD